METIFKLSARLVVTLAVCANGVFAQAQTQAPSKLAGDCPEMAEATRAQCAQLDREANRISASAIFSWHEKEFADAYADKAPPALASRSPIERAIVVFVSPKLLTAERDMIDANTFQVAYRPFDWTLNDLTGRGGR